MKKYKITIREYSYETEAENEDEALRTAEDINWNNVEIEETVPIPDENIDRVEIYFNDLDIATRIELLKLYGIKEPEDMNWNIIPIATIEKPEKI